MNFGAGSYSLLSLRLVSFLDLQWNYFFPILFCCFDISLVIRLLLLWRFFLWVLILGHPKDSPLLCCPVVLVDVFLNYPFPRFLHNIYSLGFEILLLFPDLVSSLCLILLCCLSLCSVYRYLNLLLF